MKVCCWCSQAKTCAALLAEWKACTLFCYLVCRVLTPVKLLLSTKEAVDNLFPKTSAVWSVEFCAIVTMSLKEAVAVLAWRQQQNKNLCSGRT